MTEDFYLQAYLTAGVEKIVTASLKAVLRDPLESAFMVRFAVAARKASQIREAAEKKGEHIPAFLIASITSRCNLHCAGCYSRCNHATTDTAPVQQLTDEEWIKIFREASELGISFTILAGGEPLMRRGVIRAAAKVKNMLFLIFTNGMCIDNEYRRLFHKSRNLLPVISLEGDEAKTDTRRGSGVYQKITSVMDSFQTTGLPYGVSVTVTTDNAEEVIKETFLQSLADRGCRLVVFVEFVPVTDESRALAPGDRERTILEEGINRYRQKKEDMILLSFPGDEKESGGCIAAGRGFFHINSHGGAEPCPFSPYSDINVRDTSLKDALHSRLFTALREEGMLLDDHTGGCVLFQKKDAVEALLAAETTREEA